MPDRIPKLPQLPPPLQSTGADSDLTVNPTVLWRTRASALARALGAASVSREMLAVVVTCDPDLRSAAGRGMLAPFELPGWIRRLNDLRPPGDFIGSVPELQLDSSLPTSAVSGLLDGQALPVCLRALLDAGDPVFRGLFPDGMLPRPDSPWQRISRANRIADDIHADLQTELTGQAAALAGFRRLALRAVLGSHTHGPVARGILLGPSNTGKSFAAKMFSRAFLHHARSGKDGDILCVDGIAAAHWASNHEALRELSGFLKKSPAGIVILDRLERADFRALEAVAQVMATGTCKAFSQQGVEASRALFLVCMAIPESQREAFERILRGQPGVDPVDLIQGKAETEKGKTTSPPPELLSFLSAGEVMLFHPPQGSHILRRITEGFAPQSDRAALEAAKENPNPEDES